MFEIPEKFVKKLEKLDDYYILRHNKEAIIVGTKIIIKEHKEILGNVFQPFSKNIDKELPIFFLITLEKNPLDITKEFIKRKLPVLNLNKTQVSFSTENIKKLLDEFVFKYF